MYIFRTFTLTLLLLTVFSFCHSSATAFDVAGPQSPASLSVFSTISSESPGKGQAVGSFMAEKSGGPEFYRFSAQVAIGLLDNLELGINIPYVDNDSSGLEDIAVSLKHRFYTSGGNGPSFAYLVAASIQSNDENLSTDGRLGAGIILSNRLGPVNGHFNLIYSVPGDNELENEIRISGGIEFAFAHDFDILAEIAGKKSHFSDELDELEARFGYRMHYGDGVFANLGVGLGLEDKGPNYRLIMSLTRTFPQHELKIEKVYEKGE